MINDIEKINAIVKSLILKILDEDISISESDDLVLNHTLNSITFVKLVSSIEKEFNMEFDISDLNIEKFKNINLITQNILKYTK